MAWLDDLLYPDNERRRLRATQLYLDCKASTSELARQNGLIDAGLCRLAEVLTHFIPMEATVNRLNSTPLPTGSPVKLPVFLGALVNAARSSLGAAALASAASVEEKASVAFINLFGLPEGFPGKQGSVIDFSEIYGLIPAAINGATIRKQLRAIIGSLVTSRSQLKRAQMLNDAFLDTLKGLESYTKNLARKPELNPVAGSAHADELIEIFVAEIRQSQEAVTADAARHFLLCLDRDRGAWLDEDEFT